MRSLVWMSVMLVAGCDPPGGHTSGPSATVAATASATIAATASATGSATTAEACDPSCASVERCDDGRCVPACPKGEVYIPATGSDGFMLGDDEERNARHKVILTKPFCMDATEVTVNAYKECVEAGKCEAPRQWGMWINYPKLGDHPVNKVHWNHAKTYCEFRDQSLPTEAQWEWAARGGGDDKWAWGNDEPTCEHADFTPGTLESGSSDDGCHGGGTSPVGAHPKGDRETPHGTLHDLSGNVWEWCLDNFLPYPTEPQTDPAPLEAANNAHVVRGGGWNRSAKGIRVDFRGGSAVDYQVPGLGFRCVRNAK